MLQYNIYFGLTTDKGQHVTNETKGRAIDLIAANHPCFTTLESFGYWNGTREKCIKVEIIVEQPEETKMRDLCLQLAIMLEQESVLLTKYILDSVLINQPSKEKISLFELKNVYGYGELLQAAKNLGLTSLDLRKRTYTASDLIQYITEKQAN